MRPQKKRVATAKMQRSDSGVTTPTPATLYGLEDFAPKVLRNVRYVADSVAVRKQVPATSAVTVVVQPRAKDEVSCDTKEETGDR